MVKLKWGQEPKTEFKNQLDSIKVTILSCPTMEHLKSYIPEFTLATWEDTPNFNYTDEQREESVRFAFQGKLLPTALETIDVTFMVEGLDLIDVTHLIRHRVFSFSAQCTADRDMREDDVMVKPSILMNYEFMDRYIQLHKEAKQLYADMVDSKEVSIFDARTVLPRSLSSFYYVKGNIKDIIGFINTRKDEAIQPESDNVVAIRLYQQLVKHYPILKEIIKFGGEDKWFTSTAKEGHNSMAYMPKPANDVFEHTPDRFIYQKRRQDFIGAEVYNEILNEVL
jgi:thymidylate synthase (FAD)